MPEWAGVRVLGVGRPRGDEPERKHVEATLQVNNAVLTAIEKADISRVAELARMPSTGARTILGTVRLALTDRIKRIQGFLFAPDYVGADAFIAQELRLGYLISDKSLLGIDSVREGADPVKIAVSAIEWWAEQRGSEQLDMPAMQLRLNDALRTAADLTNSATASTNATRAMFAELEKARQEVAASSQIAQQASQAAQQTLAAVKGDTANWLAEKNGELEALKAALATSFATQAAHTYWAQTKFQRHTRIAKKLVFVGVAYVVGVAGMVFLLIEKLSGHPQPIWQLPASVFIPTAAAALAIIWIGRLLARTYMAHVQLAEDAQERATMIETYIALIKADAMKSSDEAVKMIFRSATSGLLAGDGGPDTPVEIAMKTLGGGDKK